MRSEWAIARAALGGSQRCTRPSRRRMRILAPSYFATFSVPVIPGW
jgi:hypothetical protein